MICKRDGSYAQLLVIIGWYIHDAFGISLKFLVGTFGSFCLVDEMIAFHLVRGRLEFSKRSQWLYEWRRGYESVFRFRVTGCGVSK